jgi:hypothetical protein
MDELMAAYSQNDLSLTATLTNLAVGLLLGMVLKAHYERFSSVMSGKRELAAILPFLILIVCLIISIVKSSLALSLGLVGALSIVRFRTPIKEPEELVYLFMAIAIGLGLGANQPLLTVSTTFAILLKALYLMIELTEDPKTPVIATDVVAAVTSHVNECELKRFDRRNGKVSATFLIEPKSAELALGLSDDLAKTFAGSFITLLDQSRIPGV